MDLQYRDNSYFNTEDYFIIETNLNKILVSKMLNYRGNWYTHLGMQYKGTSVRVVNTKEFSGSLIEREGVKGRIGLTFLEPYHVGVIWNQGQKHNFYHWNNINKLKIR